MPGKEQPGSNDGGGLLGWPPTHRRPEPLPPDRRDPAWLRELFDGSGREVLGRLTEGDPLALGDRCLFAIRTRALMLQPDRLYWRTAARLAFAGSEYRDQDIEPWIEKWIEVSIGELLSDDWAAHDSGAEVDRDAYDVFAELMKVEPSVARGMCVRFNALGERARRAFHRVVFQSTQLEMYSIEAGISLAEAASLVKQGMAAILIDPNAKGRGGPGGER